MPHRPPLPSLAAVLLALCACHRDPVAISFSDYLAHQQDHLTTGLVSVPGRINTHLLGYGWRLPATTEESAELVRPIGQIRFFAAGAEVERLVLRGAMATAGTNKRYRVILNGLGLGGVTFGTEWREHLFELPAGVVRTGINHLALRCLECPPGERHTVPSLRLGQLRLLPAPAHRSRISRTEGGEHGFLMPVPAYLDVVEELPASPEFRGELALRPQRSDEILLTLTVNDGEDERPAGRWHLGADREIHRLRADLTPWAGRLVRLRLAASSRSGGELDWHKAVVTGRHSPAAAALPLARPHTPPRSGRFGRPDIVFVLLDAARADAFRPFGGPYPSPAFEALAAEGTRFVEATAPSSWTQPSVAALLTGLYPDSIGADSWGSGLEPGVPTMAELLGAAGYRTVLWHQHPFYRSQAQLMEGFAETHWARTNLIDPVPPLKILTADDRPTFTLVHLLPPHAPYDPPAPFRGQYTSWYRGDLEVTARTLNQFHSRRDPSTLSDEDRTYIRDRYLENAAYADALVGRIRDVLIAGKRYDSTLIVVLSDHGESFLEHGRFLHTQQLYRESIHVPLIAKWPGQLVGFESVVEQPVSLVDLLPTLLDGLDIETDRAFQGRTLLPAVFAGSHERRPIYAVTRGASESRRPPSPRAAYRHGPWKAVYEPFTDRLELYDLDNDPDETRDLAPERPILMLQLRQAVLAQMQLNAALFEPAPVPSTPLHPEVEEQLRALGYLGQE